MARPREFNVDEASRVALRMFWDRGFDGASLTDLADAMGIVRPSLHAAFGSKEGLYRKAIEIYGREAMAFIVRSIRGATVADVCRLYLSGYCDMLSDPTSPDGCFMIKGLVSSGRGAPIARQEGVVRQKGYEALLEQRFRQAQDDNELSRDANIRALAEGLTTIANGLAVRADMGATRAELHRIAATLLKGLLHE